VQTVLRNISRIGSGENIRKIVDFVPREKTVSLGAAMSVTPALHEMFRDVLRADRQSRSAKTVEAFGWLLLAEGAVILFAPYSITPILQIPTLVEQAANYFRLAGLLIGGLGMLYVISGRLNAEGFVFASLLDRPLVPPAMAVLWYLGIIPGPLALVFGIQDFSGFLWTLLVWQAGGKKKEESISSLLP
jgi:hypothetical protein